MKTVRLNSAFGRCLFAVMAFGMAGLACSQSSRGYSRPVEGSDTNRSYPTLASGSNQSFLMDVSSVFDGLQPGSGVVPLRVDIENWGPEAHGTVEVSANSFTMSYPVDLPRGSSTFLTYPDCGDYLFGDLQYRLLTDRGKLTVNVPASNEGNARVVAEISQTGATPNIKASQNGSEAGSQYGYTYQGPTNVASLRPQDAPDRPIGYQRISSLVLGDGSENLSDGAIKAIRTWMLRGGTLVVYGGPEVNKILSDPRWAGVMPVSNARVVRVDPTTITAYRLNTAQHSFPAYEGDRTENSMPVVGGLYVTKPFGLGRAEYVAFDPEGLVREGTGIPDNQSAGWQGLGAMQNDIFNSIGSIAIQNALSLGIEGQRPGGFPPGARITGVVASGTDSSNPFNMRLPTTGNIFAILLIYCLAVVPLNFYILKKLNRREFAWVSAPVLSLAFAGVFFGSARGLYVAQQSTWTQGLLITQAGVNDSVLLGNAKLFFPSGGQYDLNMKNADSIQPTTSYSTLPYEGAGSGDQIYNDLSMADTGTVSSRLSVSNLSFREFVFQQAVPAEPWLEVKRLDDGSFSITNQSEHPLSQVRFVGGGGWMGLKNLQPNETIQSRFAPTGWGSPDFAGNLTNAIAADRTLAVTAQITGYKAGPEIGKDVAPDQITLVYMTNLRLKPNETFHPGGQQS